MPEQLAVATINTLQDDLVALYTGARGARWLVLDPVYSTYDATLWPDVVPTGRTYAEAVGTGADLVIPLPLCEGDLVGTVELNVWQESGTAVTTQCYSVSQDGARTARGASASTPGGTGAQKWAKLTLIPNYTLAVGETFIVATVAAVAGDKVGGGRAQVSTP